MNVLKLLETARTNGIKFNPKKLQFKSSKCEFFGHTPTPEGALDLPKWRIFKIISYLDYLVFLHAVFCTEQLYAFRTIIFSMVFRKKKLKITCPFCMGYRLTKMEDLQNNLISRLFGVFARGFLH